MMPLPLPAALRAGLVLSLALTASGFAQPAPARLPVLAQFDKNADGRLDAPERAAARAWLATAAPTAPTAPTPAPADLPALEPVSPGEKIPPPAAVSSSAPPAAASDHLDDATLHTVFLEFEDADWEAALAAFARTDVLLPARVVLDGRIYDDVGVRFLAPTADPLSPPGYKRSLELLPFSGDLAGAARLQLLDQRRDPTLLRTALFQHIARALLPAPATSFAQVVINGEAWGVYLDIEAFDDRFLARRNHTDAHARWTVAPGGDLAYLGDAIGPYRAIYHLDTPDDTAAWFRLVLLCRTLQNTPANELPAALAPLLDIDETLRFLALENALANQQGYRATAGGYGLYLDADERFHFVPLEAETSFHLVEQRSAPDERPRERRPAHHSRSPDRDRSDSARGGPGGGSPSGGKRDRAGPSSGDPADAPAAVNGPDREQQILDRHFKSLAHPAQVATDLARLLGYSLVTRADRDLDLKATRAEWLEFAAGWFFMMDENHAPQVTREQFIASVRELVTPRSVRDGKSTQTFGADDAPALTGRELFALADRNHDDTLTRDEFLATCGDWFDAWRKKKSKTLTVDDVQHGLETVLSRTVFQADQKNAIALASAAPAASSDRGGPGGGGPRRGGPGGGGGESGTGMSVSSGLAFGPLRVPTPRLGGGGRREGPGGSSAPDGDRRDGVYYAQLLPLEDIGAENRPLLSKLLQNPALRTHYLADLRTIADDGLSWEKLGPVARRYHELIRAVVRAETHKPWSYQRFVQELDQDLPDAENAGDSPNLKTFVTDRAAYLRRTAH